MFFFTFIFCSVCTDIPPGPYEYYNGNCYFLVENPNGVTFLDTAVGCVQYGGEVATLSNAIENSIVYQLLTDGETAWIGAERDPQNPSKSLDKHESCLDRAPGPGFYEVQDILDK